TLRDSKNLLIATFCLFFFVSICSAFLTFNVDFALQTQIVLTKNLYFLSIVMGVIFVVACILLKISTFAKIIYKPPVSVRVYEMEYSCVKSFVYKKSTLFVIGERQQRFALNLAKDTADKIIGILKNKICGK
ncbi:MAG: hypothetical protein Q4E87_08665, partial [bacterium]|nr:hypothetical protein [bacterium]